MEDSIQIIMRQTNYNETQTKEKLQNHNNDYVKVIEEYMEIPEKSKKPMVSVNQEKYKQFRNLMEEGYNNYIQKKSNEK